MTRQKIFATISEELDRANSMFGPFNSCHEGYAVMLEEFQEFWEEIRLAKRSDVLNVAMMTELIQFLAMGVKLIESLPNKEKI